jgi:mono/diheme cytochrome c family protein
MTRISKNKVARLLALVLLALSAGQVLAAEGEQEHRELFKQGAKLWPVYCAQCHNARPGSEFSPAQWDTIMMHMRTLPNLPSKNQRAIVEYFKSSH